MLSHSYHTLTIIPAIRNISCAVNLNGHWTSACSRNWCACHITNVVLVDHELMFHHYMIGSHQDNSWDTRRQNTDTSARETCIQGHPKMIWSTVFPWSEGWGASDGVYNTIFLPHCLIFCTLRWRMAEYTEAMTSCIKRDRTPSLYAFHFHPSSPIHAFPFQSLVFVWSIHPSNIPEPFHISLKIHQSIF